MASAASELDEVRLRSLLQAGGLLVSERELDGVLARLLDVARELTGAGCAAIGILDGNREQLADFVTAGISRVTQAAMGDPPRGRGRLGRFGSSPTAFRHANVSEDIHSYGFPHGSASMASFLDVPILIRGEAWGNLYLTEKEGGEGQFDEADEETAMVLAAWAGIGVENARLLEHTDQRRAELERSVLALEANTEIARAVGGETDLDRVLGLIAKRSRALVDAAAVAILLVDGDELLVAAAAGDFPPGLVGRRVSQTGSVAGRVIANGQAERVRDISSSLRFPLGELGVSARSGMFVPLPFRGVNLGVIEVFDRAGGPEFRSEDERILLSVAASAGTAVATAQTVEHHLLRQTLQAAEEERRHWARELHDETLQGLGGLRVLLASALRDADPATLETAVKGAVELLADEISNLRALITELRPASLDELGLEPALEALLDRVRSSSGLEISFKPDLAFESGRSHTRLAPDVETTVYRLVQESLTNIVRHAEARHAEVQLVEDDHELLLVVSDDGRGFDPSSPAPGFGMTGMRERAALMRGRIEVSSGPAGTTVRATVPGLAEVRKSA